MKKFISYTIILFCAVCIVSFTKFMVDVKIAMNEGLKMTGDKISANNDVMVIFGALIFGALAVMAGHIFILRENYKHKRDCAKYGTPNDMEWHNWLEGINSN